jgi:hypothetical protein
LRTNRWSEGNFLRALRVLRGNSIARWQRSHREQDDAPRRAIGILSNGKVSRGRSVIIDPMLRSYGSHALYRIEAAIDAMRETEWVSLLREAMEEAIAYQRRLALVNPF